MNSISNREWMFLAFVLIYSFVPTFGGLFRLSELLGGPGIIPENPRAIASPLPIVLHIVSSFIFCLIGAFQFVPVIRRLRIGWHRAIGKLVAVAGIISALTGLWMTHFFAFPEDLQGAPLYWVRIMLSISMVGLILLAITAIKARDIVKHGSFMLRAYAIGQGASTQAFLGLGWVVLVGTEPLGPARDMLMVSAWGLNLLIVELLIRSRFSTKVQAV